MLIDHRSCCNNVRNMYTFTLIRRASYKLHRGQIVDVRIDIVEVEAFYDRYVTSGSMLKCILWLSLR